MPTPFDTDTRHRWDSTLQAWLGPVAEVMLALVRVGAGDCVLDIAPNLLACAEPGAWSHGLARVRMAQLDGETRSLRDSTFDAALSRAGLVSCPDCQPTLREMRRVLKPGGQVAVAAYGVPERNAFLAIPLGIIRQATQLPPLAFGQPGPFSLAEPGALAGMLREAGFTDITVRVAHAPLRLPSAAVCASFERDLFRALCQPLTNLLTGAQEAAWDEIALVLRQFESNLVFVAPCELLVGVGMK